MAHSLSPSLTHAPSLIISASHLVLDHSVVNLTAGELSEHAPGLFFIKAFELRISCIPLVLRANLLGSTWGNSWLECAE